MDLLKAIVILSFDGKLIISKYFDDKLNPREFEKKIFNKSKNQKRREDIFLLDSNLVSHKYLTDLHLYVTDLHLYVAGSKNENPLVLHKILNCLSEVISTLSKKNVDQQPIMDSIILALDEISEGGIVLETNPDEVVERICLKEVIRDPAMPSFLQSATEQFKFPWSRS